MTKEKQAKLEELKQMAFYQAAFYRLFFIKGEIVKIEAEIRMHEKRDMSWPDMAEDADLKTVETFVKKGVETEYLKALMGAYKKEVEELGDQLEIGKQ